MTTDPSTPTPTDPAGAAGPRLAFPTRRAVPILAAAVLAVLAVSIAIVSCGSERPRHGAAASRSDHAGRTVPPPGTPGPESTPDTATPAPPSGTPAPGDPGADGVTCPPATVRVTDAGSLSAALATAQPGASIALADGTYSGKFVARTPGTADKPIFLCGGPGAVIDAGGIKGGYALHLDGASYWRVVGFTLRNGQKGLVTDKGQHNVIQGLTVEQIGDEGIHLRDFSSDNVVQGNTVRRTGLRRDKFGEGIYIGSAQSNWCTNSGCQPDASDRNIVRGNTISETTAESVDIKEGTSRGVLSGNTFDGSAFTDSGADSWVDVKGNNWLIEGNVGHHSPGDGFQTHEIVSGWGANNVFRANTADVSGPGWGFHITKPNGNQVSCDNKVTGAAKGLANISCS